MDFSHVRAAYDGRFDEVSAAMLVAVPPMGQIVSVNSEAEELTGYEKDELQSMTFATIFSEEDINRINKLFQMPLEKYKSFRKLFEHNVIIQKRSKRKVIVDMGFRMTDFEGQPLFVFTLQDITDLKNSEQRVIRAHRYVNDIIGSINESLFVIDQPGKIKTVNPSAQALLEYTEEELVGKNIDTAFELNPVDRVKVEALKTEGNAKELETTFVTKSGKIIPVQLSAAMMRNGEWYDEDSSVITAIDLTERKRVEALVTSQQMMLVQASKMSSLGEMASGIAHEINNPLHIIKGRCEILELLLEEDTVDLEGVKEAVELVESMGTRIEKIVNGLRALSRDQKDDPMEVASLSKIIKDTYALCGKRLVNNGIAVTVQEVSDDVKLFCHPTQISQVILNLLNNAGDAVEDGADGWINLDVTDAGDDVILSVSDSGTALVLDEAEKIFDPFFTKKSVGQGTGLGLSISRSIIEAHKGRIYVDKKSKSTCFIVKLPKYVD